MAAFIRALAYALPDAVVDNEALQRENADWEMSRIAGKVGIAERRVAAPDETSADLAYRAATRLLDGAGVDRGSIDALIFCTQTPDYVLPATACVLQHRLGLGTHVAAFDFNQGCSGYVYGLALAKGFIAAGLARRVLLLTGETYSKLIHPRDRTVRVLFGDAGSATLVDATGPGAEIGAIALGTDGSGAEHLIVPAGGFRRPAGPDTAAETTDAIGCTRTPQHLFMDGQAITAFALERVPALVARTLADAQLTADQVDWWVFHQANAFMNERLRGRLRVPAERTPSYIAPVGNTVVNTIPIVLRERSEAFGAGDRVLLAGFGVGYSWGATVLAWRDVLLA